MYFFKQLVADVTEPLTLTVLLALAGWLFRFIGFRKTGTAALVTAALFGYGSSTGAMSGLLLRPLETRYPPILDAGTLGGVEDIVVLASFYSPDDRFPITSNVDLQGLVRVSEGVRLFRQLPRARLVFTGGTLPGSGQTSLGNSLLAQSLGVPPESIVVLPGAVDTAGEARDAHAFLGDRPFVLVTSASHIPRAMRLMERTGAKPIAAPTAHRTDRRLGWEWRDFLPRGDHIDATDAALHEYLGLAAIALSLGGPATLD